MRRHARTPPGRPTKPVGRRGSPPRRRHPLAAARISRITASPLAESSAPDGSSASSRCRSPTTARAIATRWRSPPGQLVGKPRGPLGQDRAPPALSSPRPSPPCWAPRRAPSGRDTFSTAVEPGQQVEVLEHVADRPPPQPGPVVARHPRQRIPPTSTAPLVGSLEAPGDGQRVLFPDPLGPITATSSPASTDRWTSRRAFTSVGALAVDLRYSPQFQRGHRPHPHSFCAPCGRPDAARPAASSGRPLDPALGGVQPPDHRVQPEQLGVDDQHES